MRAHAAPALASQPAEALWRCLPQALLFPLRGYALPIVITFALLFWVGSASILGLVAFAIAISWPMKYAYHVLERTALGYVEAPQMTLELVNPWSQQPLKHLVVLFAMLSLCYWARQVGGPIIALPVLVAGLFVQPACAVVIALDDSLLAALNPRMLGGTIRALGQDYLVATGTLMAVGVLVFLLAGNVPRLIWYGLLLYGVLATFFLLGMAVYRHRGALGIEADASPERTSEVAEGERSRRLDRLLDEVYRLARADRLAPAADTLFSGLTGMGDRAEDNAQVHHNTLSWPDPAIALRHGQHYAGLLVRAAHLQEALEVCERCRRRSEAFRVERADEALRLAQFAQKLHRGGIGLHLLKDFERRFPGHPDIGAVVRLRVQLAAPNAMHLPHRS